LQLSSITAEFSDPRFWLTVLQIIWINILLSGDNAVVIALACRGLPPRERLWGMVIGAGVASALLILFTVIVVTLMKLPFLKLVSAFALVWIAAKLVVLDEEEAQGRIEASESLWRAVRIVVVADIIVSLDNVIAVAAAARGNYVLLGLGLVVSIPVVIAGSALIMAMLKRFPILVWGGVALLGWIAGDIFVTDPVVAGWLGDESGYLKTAASIIGSLLVLTIGYLWRRARRPVERET
jgi:YjbE family integral membrane protein